MFPCAALRAFAEIAEAMDQSTILAHRFKFADVCSNCFESWQGRSFIESSLLCHGTGTDSDCTGGAGGWEAGALQLDAAARERNLPVRLHPKSVSESWMSC